MLLLSPAAAAARPLPMARRPHFDPSDVAFGLELELGLGQARTHALLQEAIGAQVLVAKPDVVDRSGQAWQARPEILVDGVHPSVQGSEVVSPILHKAQIPQALRLVSHLQNHGEPLHPGAGIHIHLDGNAFNTAALLRLVALMYRFERHIYDHFGVSDFRLQNYCRPVDAAFVTRLHANLPTDLVTLRQAWYGGCARCPTSQLRTNFKSTRNQGINLHALFTHRTIELRYFPSTLNPDKVEEMVTFAQAVAKFAIVSTCPPTAHDLAPRRRNSGSSIDELFGLIGMAPPP